MRADISDLVLLMIPILILQWAGAYIRYLPFTPFMGKRKNRQVYRLFFCLLCINLLWQSAVFLTFGITVLTYKTILAIGWVPYFLSMLYVLPEYKPQQIFLMGMQGMYMYLLHALSGLTILFLFPHPEPVDFMTPQLWIYVLYLGCTYPLIRPIFMHLMPSKQLINEKPYSYYMAALPLLLILNLVPTSLMGNLWTPDKISAWLFLFPVFYVFYKYISLESADMEDQIRIQSANDLMRKAIKFLRHYALTSQESARQMSLIRHDFRHHIRALHQLLLEGHTKEALSLLETFDEDLERTVVHPYCLNPYLNAIITIYFQQAKQHHIPITYKINVPASLPQVESDLAFMLANLLENALRASRAMAEEKRYLKLFLNVKGNQVVLSIENYYDKPITFNEKGFPVTTRSGHGIGMISVASVLTKYNGYHSFTQEDGIVRFECYFMMEKVRENSGKEMPSE